MDAGGGGVVVAGLNPTLAVCQPYNVGLAGAPEARHVNRVGLTADFHRCDITTDIAPCRVPDVDLGVLTMKLCQFPSPPTWCRYTSSGGILPIEAHAVPVPLDICARQYCGTVP